MLSLQSEILKKRIYKIFILLIVFAVVVFMSLRVYSPRGNFIKKIEIGGEVFFLEKVNTADKMSLGLGNRSNICKKCGMLFVFDEEKEHSFWMKNMLFSLDIFWIRDGKIVLIKKSVPFNDKNVFGREVISDAVIELRAGSADEYGISIGDEVQL